MEQDLEGKIRSRLEAILINDARNQAEVKSMSNGEDPLDVDPFAEEKNLYQRIINNYRNAIGEVNNLLEENISQISGLCRILDAIKEKSDLEEMCLQIIDCALQDLGAEFCGMVFHQRGKSDGNPLYLEGVREQQKLTFSHSHPTLLGSREFAHAVETLSAENADCAIVGDVYRDPRFLTVDFPSVVRSMVCLPIIVHKQLVGTLVLSHSLPRFFTQNQTRILRILGATIAHLIFLTEKRDSTTASAQAAPRQDALTSDTALSVILLQVGGNRLAIRTLAEHETIRSLENRIAQALEGKESLLHYDDTRILVLLPHTSEERLYACAARLREAFENWILALGENSAEFRLSLGHATCTTGEELAHALDAASHNLASGLDDQESTAIEAGLARF
jgi:hypothetical protein